MFFETQCMSEPISVLHKSNIPAAKNNNNIINHKKETDFIGKKLGTNGVLYILMVGLSYIPAFF